MMGMEKMFASMMGMTPDQMASEFQRFRSMMEAAVNSVQETAAKQDAILAKLEAMDNGK